MIITIFEDQDYKSLFPLNINRASFELRCGAFTNLERIENLLSPDDTVQLIVRDELVPLVLERFPNITINPDLLSPGIWLNGRGLWTDKILKNISIGRTYTNNGIVIGTGNKIEDFGVGFYTKYGDGGVDISPIADLLKTEVWELGKELKILDEIMNAQPTDGLWDDGRTDESQIGLSYKELEEAMNNPNSVNRAKYEQIRKLNLHKMEPIPVCKIPN